VYQIHREYGEPEGKKLKAQLTAPKWIGLLLLIAATVVHAGQKITVYAAASLTDAVGEIAELYEREKSVKVVGSYGSSSTLAKQIENGAPADVFIPADLKWMDYLEGKNRILPESRRNLLGNKLVLIAPKGRGFNVVADKSFDLAKAFEGKLCVGEVESVPAGIYAKQALVALGWWDDLQSRIVGAQDVRAALAFVERGECAAGIVYETDAKISDSVELVFRIPVETHEPIRYPVAAVSGSGADSLDFIEFLASPAAGAIFERYGFSLIEN
jgi:molybdate transport system substrate-binding protein